MTLVFAARLASVAVSAALIASTSAHAELTNTFVQVRASASALTEAGFTQLGSAPFVSVPSGECAVNGCVTLAGSETTAIGKGFFEFQFLNYTYNPAWYSGVFVTLDVNYGSSGVTQSQLINLINGQTSITGVTALTTAEANNTQGSCSFNEWLPLELQDALVLRWMPAAPPTSPGLSQVFRFAWDFTGVNPAFLGGGVGVDAAFGLPSPSAMALLGLAGLARHRRR